MITDNQRDDLQIKLSEGIETAFIKYSDWLEVDDKEFHRQRELFTGAYQKFEAYLDSEDLFDD